MNHGLGLFTAVPAVCGFSISEGLFRQEGESREDFCNRVYQTTKKSTCGLIKKYFELSNRKKQF